MAAHVEIFLLFCAATLWTALFPLSERHLNVRIETHAPNSSTKINFNSRNSSSNLIKFAQ
jgi:hypothetical protein